jgi:hypothetical protein
MRPARIPASLVKIVPWYYTERSAPSRAEDKRLAIKTDEEDSGDCEES